MNHERLADAAAGTGWVLWFASNALAWMPVVQLISLVCASVASIAAAIYYISRTSKGGG